MKNSSINFALSYNRQSVLKISVISIDFRLFLIKEIFQKAASYNLAP